MQAVAAGRWIRTREATTWFARTVAVLAAGFVILAVAALLSHGAPGARLLFGGVSLALAAGAVWLARSYAQRGLMISPDGVVIRNLMRTQRISLAEADGFRPEVPAGAGRPCPVLHLRDGHAVAVGGLARVDWLWHYEEQVRGLVPVCDELNGLLAQVARTAAA